MLALGALEKPLPNTRPRPVRPTRNGDTPESKTPLRRATSSKLPLSSSANGKASTAIPVRKISCGSTVDLPSAVSGTPTHTPARRTTSAGPGGAPVNGVKRRSIPATPPKKPSSSLPRPAAGSKPTSPPVPAANWRELSVAAEHARPGGGQYRNLEEFEPHRAKSEEQLAAERSWLSTERLWLVHRGGFTAVSALQAPEDGPEEPNRLRVRVEATGEILVVDEDDVEKANPSELDCCEDLARLRYLNESAALHIIRQRFGNNLIHTYAGPALLVVNPMAPLSIYSHKVAHMFRGCKPEDMPAHIYAAAQSAYRTALSSRRDNSLVFLGRSGAGKTTNFRHAVHYLAMAAGAPNKVVTVDKLNAVWTVVEAFGNATTTTTSNATRFTQLFSLDIDQSGQIVSASIQLLLMELWRVSRPPQGEGNYHIFYRLLAGAEGALRRELNLDVVYSGENNAYVTLFPKMEDKQKAHLEFTRVVSALTALGISDADQHAIWCVVAAIYHFGFAGAARVGSSQRWQFANPQAAQRAAQLLGTSVEELAHAILGGVASPAPSSGASASPSATVAATATLPRNSTFRTPSPSPSERSLTSGPSAVEVTGQDALDGFVVGLYSEVFGAVGALINRSLSSQSNTMVSLLMVDCPGLHNPAACGNQAGATFSDLCHNYLAERLQLLFHNAELVAPKDRYNQENIQVDLDPADAETNDENSPSQLVALLDRSPTISSVVRSSQTDLRHKLESERRGLFFLLEEESSMPGASDASFLDRLFSHYNDRESQLLLRRASGNKQFVLQHLQGTNPVLYSANGWLKSSRENPASRIAASVLQESSREEVSKLFVSCRGAGFSSTLSGASVVSSAATFSGCDGGTLRRASSIRRTLNAGTAAMKRRSIGLQVKFIADGLVETLRRTRLHFVLCVLPQHNAGHCDFRKESTGNSLQSPGSPTAEDSLINVPLLRSQLRGFQLLAVVRLHKQGFPKFLPLWEFRRRFRLLAPPDGRPVSPVDDERKTAQDLVQGIDLEQTQYRIGLSQIFFRAGVLEQLEAQRDDRLSDHVTRLQARCRGYLARKRLAKLKVQDLAVRCIQRNVRKFMMVRDWPWWRLLVRVTPLLNVHRTEEELRSKSEELETLKAKVEKLEAERFQLKHENDRLESKSNNGSTASLNARMLRVGGLSIDNRRDFRQGLNGAIPVRRSYTSQSLHSNGHFSNHVTRNGLANGNNGEGVLPYRLIQQFNQPLHRRQRSCRTSVCTELSRSSSPGSLSGTFSPRSGSSGSSRTLMSPKPYESGMPAPRRIYPQRASQPRLIGIEDTDGSPVVFDAELSFGIGSPPNGRTQTRVDQRVQPTAAHLEPSTTSAYISRKIADFLQRTDHVMEEWKRLGRKDPDEDMRAMMGNGGRSLERSRSAANIMTRAMRYFSRSSSVVTTATGHTLPPEDFTLSEEDELSGLTVDLADEHSTATLASERLEVEVSDRLRLEKELGQVQEQNKRLQQSAERLELELLHSRTADLNGLNSEEEDSTEDGGGDASAALRARYERTVRELDFTKRRLQQQHEDDLEQLVALKKQLEKKLADAYEEVEEQRQVVGQWKRKVQKLSAETSDLRLLVETQSSRNNFLEKKQRKFDSELQLLQDELRQEKQHRERITREKDLVLGEKYSLEQTLSSVRIELESREERVAALTRELEELTFGGKTEEDVAAVKKARHQLEQRVKEQEEELDDMAGQVQLLEQAKLRLEMSLEQMRKENRREIAQRDDELEDARSQAYKKCKALESQLESEHEERSHLVREKHELERRLNAVEEEARARAQQEDGLVQRLRRDLRRTRALLNDAHSQLERLKADTPSKAAVRTLRNQLEDLEFARAQAVKARQSVEAELSDVQSALEEAQRAKQDSEERGNILNRECSELRTQLEENEEELAEVLKKYRAAVHQMSSDQIALQDSVARIGELEAERNTLSEQLADLTARLANIETMADPSSSVAAKRLELRTKELESRLELEQTTRGRMEVQISRLKENVDKLETEITQSRTREALAQDASRKAQRSLRELREEIASLTTRENESTERRKCLEKRVEISEAEAATAKADLKAALQRIEDLQQAIQGDLELESSGSDNSDNDNDSDDSDESIETFLAHHNMASNSNRLSGSFTSKRSSWSDRSPRSENADSSLSGQSSNTPKDQAS